MGGAAETTDNTIAAFYAVVQPYLDVPMAWAVSIGEFGGKQFVYLQGVTFFTEDGTFQAPWGELSWEKFASQNFEIPDLENPMDTVPILTTGVTALACAAVMDSLLNVALISICFKCLGVAAMIIAAYVEGKSAPSSSILDEGKSFNIVDGFILTGGIVAVAAGMIDAIFNADAWLLLCLALGGGALMHSFSIMKDVDLQKGYAKENEKFATNNETLARSLAEQKEQLTNLGLQNQSYRESTQLLAAQTAQQEEQLKILSELTDNLKKLAAGGEQASQISQLVVQQFEQLSIKNASLKAGIEVSEQKLDSVTTNLSKTEEKLAERQSDLEEATQQLLSVSQLIQEQIQSLSQVSTKLSSQAAQSTGDGENAINNQQLIAHLTRLLQTLPGPKTLTVNNNNNNK